MYNWKQTKLNKLYIWDLERERGGAKSLPDSEKTKNLWDSAIMEGILLKSVARLAKINKLKLQIVACLVKINKFQIKRAHIGWTTLNSGPHILWGNNWLGMSTNQTKYFFANSADHKMNLTTINWTWSIILYNALNKGIGMQLGFKYWLSLLEFKTGSGCVNWVLGWPKTTLTCPTWGAQLSMQ